MKQQTGYCSAFNQDLSETIAYNNPLFPAYARYGILSRYPDYSAVSHWHGDLEFILIKKGRMTYHVNGDLIELTENNGIMVNSRQVHYGFSAKRQECEFICILLSPELFRGNQWFYENCIEQITENTSCPYLFLDHGGWQKDVLDRLERLYAVFENDSSDLQTEPLSYFEVMEHFISIMKILFENLPGRQTVSKKESPELTSFKDMITYIENHYTEHIALEDIASAGACCKSRCSVLFKKYLRDTPISYTTKLRLRKSLAALLDSDACITDIAYEYGFGGASYYCETFRKYYKISPLKYRQMFNGAQTNPRKPPAKDV